MKVTLCVKDILLRIFGKLIFDGAVFGEAL
jgi:hypothetical protein